MPMLRAAERIGTVIGGRYRIDGIVGSGGMATVFAGTDMRRGVAIAVKVLQVEDPIAVRRFVREARTAGSLSHPNIVEVYDTGETDDGAPFLVLELLDGESLLMSLKRGPLTPEQALATLLPIMDAVSHAHAAGVLHRDIKPANLVLHRDARGRTVPKLVDFGITKIIKANVSVPTATGTMVGTPQYMSPEQVQASKTIGPPTDVWSMGAVLFEMLSGRRAFEGTLPMLVLVAIVTGEAPPLSDVAPDVPRPIAKVVDRTLKRSLEERHATMDALIDDLVRAAREAQLDVVDPRTNA